MGVRDWQAGPVWRELVAARDLRVKPAGPKGPQLTLTLYDVTGERLAKVWKSPPELFTTLAEAVATDPPLLRVSGRVEECGPYAGELVIETVTAADPEEGDPRLFLEPLPLDHPQLVTGLDCLISQVSDPYLSRLLYATIGPDAPHREAFTTAVAAQGNHHAYRGGLLRHSLEVAEFAAMTLLRFPDMNHDLLLSAALLHDLGKIWEMNHDWRRGEYTMAGNLLGHIHLGASHLETLCLELEFPGDLREQFLHCVVAHHDKLEFGSPKRPMIPEAIAIAKGDQLSAELTAYFDALREKLPGSGDTVRKSDRWFYVGKREATDATPDPLDPEERLLRRLPLTSPTKPAHFAVASGVARLLVLGTVAAGDGVQSAEEAEAEGVDVLLPEGGADFLLRVIGDSMTGAGIYEGDLLLVRRQETARPGQIVIAHTPGHGPVVKRLTATPRGRYLTSENPAYAPIPVTPDTQLQGVVVRLERVF